MKLSRHARYRLGRPRFEPSVPKRSGAPGALHPVHCRWNSAPAMYQVLHRSRYNANKSLHAGTRSLSRRQTRLLQKSTSPAFEGHGRGAANGASLCRSRNRIVQRVLRKCLRSPRCNHGTHPCYPGPLCRSGRSEHACPCLTARHTLR